MSKQYYGYKIENKQGEDVILHLRNVIWIRFSGKIPVVLLETTNINDFIGLKNSGNWKRYFGKLSISPFEAGFNSRIGLAHS